MHTLIVDVRLASGHSAGTAHFQQPRSYVGHPKGLGALLACDPRGLRALGEYAGHVAARRYHTLTRSDIGSYMAAKLASASTMRPATAIR